MDLNLSEYAWRAVKSRARPALCFRDRTLSYAELFGLSAKLADALLDWGVGARQRVLLPLSDTPAMVAAFLGCLTMGAVPVPLNPKLSRETLRYIVRDSGAAAVICEPEHWAASLEVVDGERERPLLIVQDLYATAAPEHARLSLRQALAMPGRAAFVGVPEDEAAFWQYTSGTTGEPKAVKHHARAMIESNELYARGVLSIGQGDRLYSTAKMFFGYGLGNSLFFGLLNQALALLDDRWPSPAQVIENVRRFKPSVLFSVPALYQPLREYGAELAALMGPSARYCSAGSQLPASLFADFRDRFGIELLDGIGATEMGHIFMSNRQGHARPGSTGTPVGGYRVELRDAAGERISDGRQGVLWVAGPSMSLGYHDRPDSTQERFRDGWYRTGDVFIPDGHGGYTYLGREDDLFKVNGQWVAPAQIEQFVLGTFSAIKEAALVPYETSEGLLRPMLFVVATDDGTLLSTLTDALAREFEPYKRPTGYRVVSALPKNDNGKLLRRALISSARGHHA